MLKKIIMFMFGSFVTLRSGRLQGRTNNLNKGKQTALFLLTLIMCLFLQAQPSWSATTLYSSFTGAGIWQYNGSSWTQATSNTPTIMAVSGSTLYGVFAGAGIYKYDGTSWTQVTPNTPTAMVISGGTLYGVFTGAGIWKYDGTNWTQATPNTPTIMAVSGSILYGAFAGAGIWKYDGTTWTQATSNTPTIMAVSGSTLYGVFAGAGIWKYDGTTWTQATPNTPTTMTVSGSTLYGVFAGAGIYKYDGTNWTQVTPNTPQMLAVSGGTLYGAFAGGGIWQYNGSTWTQATSNTPTIMAANGSAAPGTFTKQFGVTASSSNVYPFHGTNDSKSQHLYYAAEIGGSGMITKIRLQQASATGTAVTCPNTTIKMGHTNLTALTTTWASNLATGQGSEQTVLNNATITIPVAAGGSWIDIPLDTPFNYNGVDNLVVDFERTTKCSANVGTTTYNAATNRRALALATDNVPGTAEYDTTTAGYVDVTQQWMQFVFSGGDNAVTYPSPGGNVYPFGQSVKIQLLYTAAEINGSGIITGIGFPVANSPTAGSSATTTVTLGHTNLSGLTGTYANNFNVGTPVVVANAQTFTVPAGVPNGGYVWIPIPDGTFNYDGTDNLVVQIETSNLTGSTSWLKTNYGTNTRVYGAFGATTGTPDVCQYLIKFRFAGGTVDVIAAGGYIDSYPFSSSTNNKHQYLYFAEELGTKGSINKVACRLAGSSSTSSYNSFSVVLGHTTSTALGSTTFSGTMADAKTVFSGTFTVPAGLAAGDWIEIPLTTPFDYDGTRNLVVQMSALQGTAGNNVITTQDNTLYLNRHNHAESNTTDTVSGINNFLGDLRLFMQ